MRHYEEKNSYYKNELERQKGNVELRGKINIFIVFIKIRVGVT